MQEQHISELKKHQESLEQQEAEIEPHLEELASKYVVAINTTSRQEIVYGIYYARSGFGSLDAANKKDPSMKMEDVKQFCAKHTAAEKRKRRGQNRFFAPHSFYEFQLDFFISNKDLENQQELRIGLFLIHIFSKYATLIPTKSKQPPDVLAGLMEGLQKMGKTRSFFTLMRKVV